MSAFALNMTKDAKMVPELDTAGFLSLSPKQRVARCREMAAEAEQLAAGKTGEVRASYLDLATKWSELADEMARADGE
jgi:hypothetical protein